MKGDLRVIRARLHAEIATRDARIQALALKGRKRAQCRRPAGQTQPAARAGSEQPWSEPDRDRQLRGAKSARLTRIQRWLTGFLLPWLVGLPRGQYDRSGGPLLKDLLYVFDRFAGQIERGEAQVVLRGGRDPGLMGSIERDGRGIQPRRGCIGRLRGLSGQDMVQARADAQHRGARQHRSTRQMDPPSLIGVEAGHFDAF